jgi:hypothetical protein
MAKEVGIFFLKSETKSMLTFTAIHDLKMADNFEVIFEIYF